MGSGGVPRGGEGVPPISHRDLQPPDTGTGGSLRSRRPRALGVTGVSGVTGRWQRSGGWDRGHAHPAPRWPLAPASPRTRPEPGGGGARGGWDSQTLPVPPKLLGVPSWGGGGSPLATPPIPGSSPGAGGSRRQHRDGSGSPWPPHTPTPCPPPFRLRWAKVALPSVHQDGGPRRLPPPLSPPRGEPGVQMPPPPPTHNTSFVESFPFY